MFLRGLKNIIFWSYGRTTWQYDILCVLILAFVFLTPKSWFERGKLACNPSHQNGRAAGTLLVRAANSPAPAPDAHDIERCARRITGNDELRVTGWREVQTADGRTVAYEIDIR
jgi:hypothetical protein